jgi:hypothetical protein
MPLKISLINWTFVQWKCKKLLAFCIGLAYFPKNNCIFSCDLHGVGHKGKRYGLQNDAKSKQRRI